MQGKITLVRGSVDAKFLHIEKIFQSFQRRFGASHATGIIPPVPLIGSINEPTTDPIMEFLVPVDGIFTCVAIGIKEMDVPVCTFLLSLTSKSKSQVVQLDLKQNFAVFQEDIPVISGDLASVSVTIPEGIKGINITALYQINQSYCHTEKILLEMLEAKSQEIADEALVEPATYTQPEVADSSMPTMEEITQ